ncbi:MAG: hypothetical protein GWO24_37410 [Akkermansiaceae bacterium]|nr:hypothetical protein [Akkermansiaceae bacterium]
MKKATRGFPKFDAFGEEKKPKRDKPKPKSGEPGPDDLATIAEAYGLDEAAARSFLRDAVTTLVGAPKVIEDEEAE